MPAQTSGVNNKSGPRGIAIAVRHEIKVRIPSPTFSARVKRFLPSRKTGTHEVRIAYPTMKVHTAASIAQCACMTGHNSSHTTAIK